MISFVVLFFFFNDTATTEIYTLSLHDALPICSGKPAHNSGDTGNSAPDRTVRQPSGCIPRPDRRTTRSEEHTSELQSRQYLVCRLLLEKKKKQMHYRHIILPSPEVHIPTSESL